MLKPKIAAVSVLKICGPNVIGIIPLETISSSSSLQKSPSGPIKRAILLTPHKKEYI